MSTKFHLDAHEPLDHGVRRVAHGRIDDAVRAVTEEARDVGEAIHCCRKQIKKLRALVRLVRNKVGEETYRSENATLRELSRKLGDARDADVMLATFEALLEDARLDRAALEPVRAELARRRDAAQPRREREADRDRLREVVDGLRATRRRVNDWPLDGVAFDDLLAGVRRIYRQGGRNMEACYRPGVSLDAVHPETFHDWRKRAKDLWYHVRILGEAWPEMLKPYRDALKELADHLGDDHDLAVLRHTVEAMNAPGVEPLFTAIDAKRRELEAKAQPLGRRIYADSPRAFTDRLARLWATTIKA